MFLSIFLNPPRFFIFSKIAILFRLFVFAAFGMALILGFPLKAWGQNPQFPYKAQVIHQGALLRSGPGQEYYPTEVLKAGQIVEVYRHEADGWCAIRPPEGSFSWVFTRYLELGADGLARAKEDQVPVVVGSRLKNLQDVIQVHLKQGELVELLEEDTDPQRIAKQVWCKIAPPSGEFRWVWGQDIRPVDAVTQGAASSAAMASDDVSGSSPGTASVPTGPSPSSGSGSHPSSSAPPAAPPGAVAIPAGAGGLSPEDFRRQFNQIALELAERVMGEPNGWQLQDLRGRTETLLGQAPDAACRSEARQVLARIVRFMEVQRQYGEVALAGRSGTPKPNSSTGVAGPAAATADGRANQPPSAPAVASATAPPTVSSGNPAPASGASPSPGQVPSQADRFDAVGRLSRVASTKPGAPTYALLNAEGEVISYITPAPGINLHPFEGKWIGVNGVAGLMLEPRAKHVAVKQVAVVDSPTSVLR
mgnify:FL=1